MPLPNVLSDPPWRRAAAKPAAESPAVRSSARSLSPPRLLWQPGEREAFRGKPPPRLAELAEERLFEKLLDECDKRAPLRASEVGRLGDEKLAELAEELDGSTTELGTLKLLLGRLGDAIAAHAVTIVRGALRERGLFEGALPLESAELALTAATAFFERALPSSLDEPCTRTPTEAWIVRHPKAVAEGLAEAAEDEAHPNHRAARAALAFVAAHGLGGDAPWLAPFADLAPIAAKTDAKSGWTLLLAVREDPRAVALLEGEPAGAPLAQKMQNAKTDRELAAVPQAVAELPPFFGEALAAAPRLTEGTPLPESAVRALGEMLRFSPLANPYPGVAQVRSACDLASLDAFALALFEAWRAAGEDPRESWAFEACGKLGGERCARAVAERVRSWARGAEPPRYGWSQDERRMVLIEGGGREFSFARSGCILLAALANGGTELAATLLDDLARGGVQVWLRREASRALGRPDDGPHDDVEAPVPDVGLDADGTATLSTGPRTYRVKIDDALVPILAGDDGEPIASFPRPKKDDDPKAYAAAKERFAGIVKDAKIVARYQLALLERMMCSERTFRADAFRERFLAHPFLRHAGRRVVWSARGTTFRIAEDGTFADRDDALFELGEGPVGVPHPVTMPPSELETWRNRFADYQIVQPFRQLERELFRPRAEDIGAHEVGFLANAKTSRGRLFQLGRREWRAIYDDVAPGTSAYAKELRGGAHVRVTLSPAVTEGADADEPYTIVSATSSHALDRIPPIELSEALRDLDYLRARV